MCVCITESPTPVKIPIDRLEAAAMGAFSTARTYSDLPKKHLSYGLLGVSRSQALQFFGYYLFRMWNMFALLSLNRNQ